MKILLIEDDEFKKRNIEEFLDSLGGNDVSSVGAVNSAISSLRENTYDLIILDMSLPTFDFGPNEKGGRPQGFGGREILRQLERFEIVVPVIVVTQYATFDDENEYMRLEELDKKLMSDHPENFYGLVFYDASADNWKNGLEIYIYSIRNILKGEK